jgi:predicted DNA-binding transcriptional regulator AlpA
MVAIMSDIMQKKLAATPTEVGFINERELLKRLPVSRRTLFTWVQSGKLPVCKIGRRKIFHWPSCESALLRIQRGGE